MCASVHVHVCGDYGDGDVRMSANAVMMMRMVVAVYCGVYVSACVRMFVVLVGADGDGCFVVYVCVVVLVTMAGGGCGGGVLNKL